MALPYPMNSLEELAMVTDPLGLLAGHATLFEFTLNHLEYREREVVEERRNGQRAIVIIEYPDLPTHKPNGFQWIRELTFTLQHRLLDGKMSREALDVRNRVIHGKGDVTPSQLTAAVATFKAEIHNLLRYCSHATANDIAGKTLFPVASVRPSQMTFESGKNTWAPASGTPQYSVGPRTGGAVRSNGRSTHGVIAERVENRTAATKPTTAATVRPPSSKNVPPRPGQTAAMQKPAPQPKLTKPKSPGHGAQAVSVDEYDEDFIRYYVTSSAKRKPSRWQSQMLQ